MRLIPVAFISPTQPAPPHIQCRKTEDNGWSLYCRFGKLVTLHSPLRWTEPASLRLLRRSLGGQVSGNAPR
jgi:hypothetical protein